MRVTVCQLRNQTAGKLEEDWRALAAHCQEAKSELVLLPEMPFYRWVAVEKEPDPQVWRESVSQHQRWLGRLGELGVDMVAGSAPILRDGVPYNEGFLWHHEEGYQRCHLKHYLPDEEGFWEARWYRRGSGSFQSLHAADVTVGMMICTDIWFLEHARALGRQGIQLLLAPRATMYDSREKWLTGGRVAAICSGAYCLSSNPRSLPAEEADLGGMGWIIDPDGQVLATTDDEQPFVTGTLDLSLADRAKGTYPRYVRE